MINRLKKPNLTKACDDMKKKYWISIIVILIIAISFVVSRYFLYDEFKLPFKAEDVQSVTISNIWEYKIVESEPEMELLISEFNKIKTVPSDIPSKHQIADGAIGYSFYFELEDGRQLEYSTAPTQAGGIHFVDENGKEYSAQNFAPDQIWNQLDAETFPPTPRNFYAICYQGQIYKGTADAIEVPKDAQLVGTVTGITYSPDNELECSIGKTGQNVYVWQENGIGKIGVEIEQNVWPNPQASTIDLVSN